MRKLVLHYAAIDSDSKEVKKEFRVCVSATPTNPIFKDGKIHEDTLNRLARKSDVVIRRHLGEKGRVPCGELRRRIQECWR